MFIQGVQIKMQSDSKVNECQGNVGLTEMAQNWIQ